MSDPCVRSAPLKTGEPILLNMFVHVMYITWHIQFYVFIERKCGTEGVHRNPKTARANRQIRGQWTDMCEHSRVYIVEMCKGLHSA